MTNCFTRLRCFLLCFWSFLGLLCSLLVLKVHRLLCLVDFSQSHLWLVLLLLAVRAVPITGRVAWQFKALPMSDFRALFTAEHLAAIITHVTPVVPLSLFSLLLEFLGSWLFD
jgi:hypothetical protein